MKCCGCGHENRDAAKFCEQCAAPVRRNCQNCGAELRATAKFCDECASAVAASDTRTLPPNPRSYTPSHLAERIQVGRVLAYCGLGIANVLNREWHDALEALGEAQAIGRKRRLLVGEGGVLGVMAAAHLGLGDRAKALGLAEEAIAVCRRRGARLWEFSALLTRIRALRETQGVEATREIEAALAEADAWIEMSGAKSYEPFLCVERAELARLGGDEAARQRELREAHQLFIEMGATSRAAEVAKELRSAAAT
jgi:hypothetical protein